MTTTVAVIRPGASPIIKVGENTAAAAASAALASVARIGAETAQAITEQARDVATATADFPTLAAAQAAFPATLSEGQTFSYLDADNLMMRGKIIGGVATELAGPYIDANKVGVLMRGVGAVASDGLRKLQEAPSVLDWMSDELRDKVLDRTAGDADRDAILTAINNAEIAISTLGGGLLRMPAGYYPTRNYIREREGVYLIGDGYATHIHNNATSGFSKVVIASGNMGDPGNDNSLFDEAGHALQAITAGDHVINLVTAGDASNYSVGQIIGIESFEKWTGAWVMPNDDHGKLLNMNQIVAIDSGAITLRYPVPDTYASAVDARPQIKGISGSINGYDGQPLWMTADCGASNMRITQSTGGSSGWYALFPCGINQQYERLWMDNCSTMIGTNNLGRSLFRDIEGAFEAGFLDFAEWQTENTIQNVRGKRFAANPVLNRIGLSCSNGGDNVFERVHASLGGWGGYTQTKTFRGGFWDCRIVGSGSVDNTASTQAILLGYGEENSAIGCKINGQHKYGVQIVGERHCVDRCSIPATNVGYTSVYAIAGVQSAFINDNEFGSISAPTSRDRFQQQTARQPGVKTSGNTGYDEHFAKLGAINDGGFTDTDAATWTTIKTASLKGATGINRGIRITSAAQLANGTGSPGALKEARIMVAGVEVAKATHSAASSVTANFEIIITVTTGNTVRVNRRVLSGTTMQQQGQVNPVPVTTADFTVELQGQVANDLDSVASQQFIVEFF